MADSSVTLTFRLDPELRGVLESHAEDRGHALGREVRLAVEAHALAVLVTRLHQQGMEKLVPEAELAALRKRYVDDYLERLRDALPYRVPLDITELTSPSTP